MMTGTQVSKPRCVAFIPARAGSKRVVNKSISRLLHGQSLGFWTVIAAKASGVFTDVYVSSQSDDPIMMDWIERSGAKFIKRPDEYGTDESPDIEWLRHALEVTPSVEAFSILRLTSPFRQPETIRRAWSKFSALGQSIDSLRAVELVQQHPGKMWTVVGDRLVPLLLQPEPQPWHSSQYKTLPQVWIQNASLEIAWTRVVEETNTISGDVIAPFYTEGVEGFDINTELDMEIAQKMIVSGEAALPDACVYDYYRRKRWQLLND